MTPAEKAKATREANKVRRAAREAFDAKFWADKDKVAKTAEKLGRLTAERGATPAEAESARRMAAMVRAKLDAMPERPPVAMSGRPLPKTVEELLALRKVKRPLWTDNKTETNDNALKLDNERLRAHVAALEQHIEDIEGDNVELTGEIAKLEAQLAATKRNETKLNGETKPETKSKGGRPPIGVVAMTANERLRAFRARQRQRQGGRP